MSLVDDLIKSMDEDPAPGWRVDEYHAAPPSRDFEVWIANGGFRICRPFELSFSIWDKFRLRAALRRLKVRQAKALLK